MHPFLLPLWVYGQYEHDIYYIDLAQSEGEIWHGFDKGCKSAIKKAERFAKAYIVKGVLIAFPILYHKTISRVGAYEAYEFDNKFFYNMEKNLDCFSSFIVDEDYKYLCVIILLICGDYCHYFLSATDPEYRNQGLNNLALWEAIKWSKDRGAKIFNLGGGMSPNDKLESFKRSFSRASKPFYTYRKIHNQEIYNQLCEDRGVDPNSKGFFPAYRK